MKIVADRNIPFLENRIHGAELIALPADEIDRHAVEDADALVVRTRTRCDSALLRGSGVRLVATATIGTDHIDLPWCEANGITVRNAPGCNAPGVALYVWSSLLRSGFRPETHTLGIVGCGNVGGIIAGWARRLGVDTLICDPPRKDAGHDDFEYLPLEEVLRRSDAVTVHTPLTRGGEYPTFHIIDRHTLPWLKPGAIFVNAARGEVADTEALCDAIADGRIGKAVIDTWEGEPRIDPRLLSLSDIATCHIAGYSVEGKQRATRMALEAVARTLGVEVDLTGLQGEYKAPAALSAGRIVGAYDPTPMTAALKADPAAFETLRNTYPLHREIL